MKVGRRWRRLAWRLNTHTYAAFAGSMVLSLAVMRFAVTPAGPRDNYRERMAAGGSYKRRRAAEVDDNPLYRLPENPAGGHRADGLSAWGARAKHFEHH